MKALIPSTEVLIVTSTDIDPGLMFCRVWQRETSEYQRTSVRRGL